MSTNRNKRQRLAPKEREFVDFYAFETKQEGRKKVSYL